jgi:hypothetical protein
MMKVYARVDSGEVVEVIPPRVDDEGAEIEIERRFTEEFVATLVEITDLEPSPEAGWIYDGEKLSAPKPHIPSEQEIIEKNTAHRDNLLSFASASMTPLLVSLQLANATTEEIASAKAWQTYVRALNAIDLKVAEPDWPESPTS